MIPFLAAAASALALTAGSIGQATPPPAIEAAPVTAPVTTQAPQQQVNRYVGHLHAPRGYGRLQPWQQSDGRPIRQIYRGSRA